jgi:hypothetical protein
MILWHLGLRHLYLSLGRMIDTSRSPSEAGMETSGLDAARNRKKTVRRSKK